MVEGHTGPLPRRMLFSHACHVCLTARSPEMSRHQATEDTLVGRSLLGDLKSANVKKITGYLEYLELFSCCEAGPEQDFILTN